jgi:hypothetical protein
MEKEELMDYFESMFSLAETNPAKFKQYCISRINILLTIIINNCQSFSGVFDEF